MEVVAQDPGFVLHEESGLYFHASSGFFHDAAAGWYYNTHDGVYYKFEDGSYVPIVASQASADPFGIAIPAQAIAHKDKECNISDEDEPGALKTPHFGVVSDLPQNGDGTAFQSDPSSGSAEGCEGAAGGGSTTSESLLEDSFLSEVGFPLWYYDSLRSIYWFYDKGSRAYYQYHESHGNATMETEGEGGNSADIELSLPGSSGQKEETIVLQNGESEGIGGEVDLGGGEDEKNFKPASGWVEEALIDLYLRGYPSDEAEKDTGPWITSADIFSDGSPKFPADDVEPGEEQPFQTGEDRLASELSDDDRSEELEEGEWVPDEPLRIVDDGDLRSNREEDIYGEKWECSRHSVHLDDGLYGCNDVDLHAEDVEEGEIEQDDIEGTYDAPSELQVEEQEVGHEGDGQRSKEEQWQAQFGQVVREKARELVIPGAVDLWDWTIVEMETRASSRGKAVKKLVGRIASSVTKLVSASSGVIRSRAICAAELDFVRVSSGKIYRLHRPSLQHLNSQQSYDSANPTKDWGFPPLGIFSLQGSEVPSEDEETGALVRTEQQSGSSVSKPFVPNTRHWRFQGLHPADNRKSRGVPAALLASKYLSPEEILMNEQRKQKYRDRAAERRVLHRGFGTGPGQKGLTPREQEQDDAESAAGMEGALRRAALAPPLGKNNVGKKMLKGMGWKEGQTLGVEGGLSAPLEAQGNHGRSGLGWR